MDPLPFGVENTISSVPQPPRSLEGSYDSSSGDSPVSSHSSNGIHTGFGGSIITIPPTRKLPPLHPHTAMVTHLPQTLTSEWWNIFFSIIFFFSFSTYLFRFWMNSLYMKFCRKKYLKVRMIFLSRNAWRTFFFFGVIDIWIIMKLNLTFALKRYYDYAGRLLLNKNIILLLHWL